LVWALDQKVEGCPRENPLVQTKPARIPVGPRPLREPTARNTRQSATAPRSDRVPPPTRHAHVRERLPALGLRRARADPPATACRMARQRSLAQLARLLPTARAHDRMTAAGREARIPLREAPIEGSV